MIRRYLWLCLVVVVGSIPLAGIPVAAAQVPVIHHARLLAHKPLATPLLSATWSEDGERLLLVTRAGQEAQVTLMNLTAQPHTFEDWGRSAYRFSACFGPVGTMMGGPERTPAPPPSRAKPPLRRGTTPAPRQPVAKDAKAPAPTKRQGIYVFRRGLQSFLYRGWRPRYSQAARRLLFSNNGLMYLWNPLPGKGKKGLALISRGYQPAWSHNGRAIAFLRKPWRLTAKGVPSGGGIWIVDMLFRAGRLTQTGGEMAWSSSDRSMAYIDIHKEAGKPDTTALFFRTLKKGKQPIRLAIDARFPALPVGSHPHTKGLVAYQNTRGVWLIHLKSKKRRLIAPKATHPQWSAKGDLLVQYEKAIAVLRLNSQVHAWFTK